MVAAASYRRLRPLSISRCFSSAAPNPQNKGQEDPWWSLASLHKKVATIIATSLPDSSRSDLHHSLSKSLNNADSHRSHSINEAIVSANARDASVQQFNRNNAEKQKEMEKKIEKEIEQRALERMELELLAVKEQLKRKEEERIRLEKEQLKKREIELQREAAFAKWQEKVAKEQQQEKEILDNPQHTEEQDMKGDDDDAPSSMQEHHPILGPQIAHLKYKRVSFKLVRGTHSIRS